MQRIDALFEILAGSVAINAAGRGARAFYPVAVS